MSARRPGRLISTVGTSLFGNLNTKRKEGCIEYPDLIAAWEREDWGRVAVELRRQAPDARICGAEITSIHDLRTRQIVEPVPHVLHFCVSDTSDGRAMGKVLRAYYEAQDIRVEVHVIEELQDANPGRFRTFGLRNLVRTIGKIVRLEGSPEYVAINATGGYKAQIAIAVLIGQTLGVDVYYKHERFSEIISFPPMPVSFDYDLLGRHADLLSLLETEDVIELPANEVDGPLRTLLDEEAGEGGHSMWTLAPIGQVYLEGYRQRYPAARTLPAAAVEKTAPSLTEHHYPKGFKQFVHKVWQENRYVTRCYSSAYSGQTAIMHGRFRVCEDRIVGEFRDHEMGARFVVETTAKTAGERVAVVTDLNARYGTVPAECP